MSSADLLLPIVWALLGRLLAYYVRRPALSWDLLWNIPVAIVMAVLGMGVADYFGLTLLPTRAVIVTAAYLGPASIDWLVLTARRRLSDGAGG